MENQQSTIIDYLGGFQYKDGNLDSIHTPEGYVKAVHAGETTEYHYVYNYTDHTSTSLSTGLGNIRLSYARDPETYEVAILKESHYYPFGLQHKGYVSTHQIFPDFIEAGKVELLPVRNYLDDCYRYTFGGKEEQLELGLNWIDHHARNYDAALGRWMNVDPLGEKYPSMSSYVYAANNPIKYIDPDGREWKTPSDEKKAAEIQNQIKKRINEIERVNSRLSIKIDKAKSKEKIERVKKLEERIENNELQINDLNKGIDEIQMLGDTEDFIFTFTKVNKENHNIKLLENGAKPLFSLEYSSNAIALHEARHAHQYITEGKSGGFMFINNSYIIVYRSPAVASWYESKAYQLQYSFSRKSLPLPTSHFRQINSNWLKSIPGNPYKQ